MARLSTSTLAISALLVLLAVSTAFAQPCIECKDCKSNHCFRSCKARCPAPVIKPPIVSGDACRRRGVDFGRNAAKDACDSTLKYCAGGMKAMALSARMGIGLVTRPQCANIAYGQCQQTATDRRYSPCGIYFNRPYKQCTVKQFMDFYTAEINEFCGKQAATILN